MNSQNWTDMTQQGASVHVNMMVKVQRRHDATPAANMSTKEPKPDPRGASVSTTRQHPLEFDEIVALVRQHGSDDPWDGIAEVQALRTSTRTNPNGSPQYHYQHRTADHDNEALWYRSAGADDVSSTPADHGSTGYDEQEESSDHVKDAKPAKTNSRRQCIPPRRS